MKPAVSWHGTGLSTSGSASDRTSGVQTSGGIALDVAWTVSYTLNPFRIAADKQAKLARSLPTKAASVVTKHMGNCLQHVLGDHTVAQLVQPGSHKRLERELRQCLAERLADSGFEVSRVMIGAIAMPAPVRKALEAAEERRLQTENEVQALSRFQQVISRFSDAEVQRLARDRPCPPEKPRDVIEREGERGGCHRATAPPAAKGGGAGRAGAGGGAIGCTCWVCCGVGCWATWVSTVWLVPSMSSIFSSGK